eukprot:g13975.t1
MNRAAAEAADEGNYINSMMILQQQELPTTADQMDEPLLQPEPQGAPPGPPAVPAVVNAAMNMNSSAAPLVPQLNIAAAATKLAKIKKAAAGAKEKLGKSKSSKDEKKSKKAAAGAAGPVGASPGAMVVVPQQGGDDEAGLHDEAVFEKHEDEFHTVKTGAKVKRLGVHTSARTSKGLSPRPDFNPEHRNTSSSEESRPEGTAQT